jgi:hypothetical protein
MAYEYKSSAFIPWAGSLVKALNPSGTELRAVYQLKILGVNAKTAQSRQSSWESDFLPAKIALPPIPLEIADISLSSSAHLLFKP